MGQALTETRQAAGQSARTTTYTYDYLGNIGTVLYPGAGAPLSYNYNNLGQLVKIPGFIEGTGGTDGITYNQGLPQTVRYANGVTLTYNYDVNGRLLGRTDTPGANQLPDLDLVYDPNGNITQRTLNSAPRAYTIAERRTPNTPA